MPITMQCPLTAQPLNFGKVTVAPKNGQFERDKRIFGPPKKTKKSLEHVLFAKKKMIKKPVKFGLGSHSNISLPRIGDSHSVPSLSLLSTETGYSDVLPEGSKN